MVDRRRSSLRRAKQLQPRYVDLLHRKRLTMQLEKGMEHRRFACAPFCPHAELFQPRKLSGLATRIGSLCSTAGDKNMELNKSLSAFHLCEAVLGRRRAAS